MVDAYETGGMGGMPIFRNFEPKEKSDRVEYGFSAGRTLWVPGSWNVQKPELNYFEGSIWYRKTFDKMIYLLKKDILYILVLQIIKLQFHLMVKY